MIQINDAVVREGTITLSDLPFRNGQRVRIVIDAVADASVAAEPRRSIEEVRALLRGSVTWNRDPTEPMIPVEDWEMLK